jgi:GntR family transcriptional regulator
MNESPELILDGAAPICEQIEGQIRRFVLSGALQPGEELPTVRTVAVELAVSPRAVEEAYDRLEQAGFVTWTDGSGPRVDLPCSAREQAELKRLCGDFLRQAADGGHSLAAVLNALQTCLEEEYGHGHSNHHDE